MESVRRAVATALKPRVTKPSEQRRAEILEAALALFSAQGFHDTTMDQVAKSAGVAKGTIYLYFPSKEHLLLDLKKDFMLGLVNSITDIVANAFEGLSAGREIDYRDIIDDVFETIIDYHVSHEDAMEVVVRLNPGPDLIGETLEIEQAYIEVVTNVFREGAAAGLIQTDDPEMTARLVNAAIRDTVASCLCYGVPADRDRLVEASKQMLYKALAPNVAMPPRKPRLVR